MPIDKNLFKFSLPVVHPVETTIEGSEKIETSTPPAEPVK
jgi:hypothetical protein